MATKKLKLSRRTRNKINKLPPKKKVYVAGRLAGKPKTEAGLAAGFSPATIHNAATNIETPDVNDALESAMQDVGITIELMARRLREGLDAKVVKTASFEGKITDTKNFVDHGQRGAYLDRITKLKGLRGSQQPGVKVEEGHGVTINVVYNLDY